MKLPPCVNYLTAEKYSGQKDDKNESIIHGVHGYRPYKAFILHLYLSEEISGYDAGKDEQQKYKVEFKAFHIIKDMNHPKNN